MTEHVDDLPADGCPNLATLRRYYEGTLDTRVTEAVRQHLSACHACEQAAGSRATDDELENLLREAETDLAPDVRRHILQSARRARDEHLSEEDSEA